MRPCLLNLVHVLALNLRDFCLKKRSWEIFLRFSLRSCRLPLNKVLNKIDTNSIRWHFRPTFVYPRVDLDCSIVESDLLCNVPATPINIFLLHSDERRQSIRKAWTDDEASNCIKWEINKAATVEHHPNLYPPCHCRLVLWRNLVNVVQFRCEPCKRWKSAKLCNAKPEMKEIPKMPFVLCGAAVEREGEKQIEKLQRAIFNCNLWAHLRKGFQQCCQPASPTMKLKMKRKRKPS